MCMYWIQINYVREEDNILHVPYSAMSYRYHVCNAAAVASHKKYAIIILLFFIFQDVYMPMMFALKMKYVLTVSEKNIDMDVGKIKFTHFTSVILTSWYSRFYVMYHIKQYIIPTLPTMINWGALYYSNSVINCKANLYLMSVVNLTYMSWRRSFVFNGTLQLFIYS